MRKSCPKCPAGGPDGEGHYHIRVRDGEIVDVWYISGNGFWDGERDPDEYFIEEVDS